MSDRVPFELPVKEPNEFDEAIYTKCIIATVKKYLHQTLDGDNVQVDEMLNVIVTTIYNHGYNQGLKHMDQMHNKLEKITNQ